MLTGASSELSCCIPLILSSVNMPDYWSPSLLAKWVEVLRRCSNPSGYCFGTFPILGRGSSPSSVGDKPDRTTDIGRWLAWGVVKASQGSYIVSYKPARFGLGKPRSCRRNVCSVLYPFCDFYTGEYKERACSRLSCVSTSTSGPRFGSVC